MTFKQFYLVCLLGITLIVSFYLILIWLENYKKSKLNINFKDINQGLFFMILAVFSWAIVAVFKFFDVKDFTLSYIINDRILSSLSNLFILSSLAFFPIKKKFFLSTYLEKKDKWVINVFVFFALTIGFFTLTDKIAITINHFLSITIITFDSIISIGSIVLTGFVLYQSLHEILESKFILVFHKSIIILFALTQIFLPLTKLIPLYLSFYYPYFLALFLVFLSFFLFMIVFYYTLLLKYHNEDYLITKDKSNYLQKNDIIEIKNIVLYFNNETKQFNLKLRFISKLNEELEEVNSNGKLLQSYMYWILFAIAKKNNFKISHPDIAIAKFRMVEYWNKDSDYKLNQEVLFYNEVGNFEFKLDSTKIEIHNQIIFVQKLGIKNLFKKHFISFIDSETKNKELLNNKKNIDSYIENNFEILFHKLFE